MANTDSAHTHFERLTKSLSLYCARAGAINKKFIDLAHYSEVCIEHIWVNQMVARATVPLMQAVVEAAQKMPDDPVCAPLIKYITRHIAEETDHDQWYANDLELLGISRERMYARMPSANVAALVGSQHYWLQHHHPVAFMGYLACLEVYHPTVEYVEGLIKKSGLPAKGFSTIMEHAEIDAHHSQDIIETLNALPLTEEQYRIVEMSAFQTFRYVALVMEDVCKIAPKQANKQKSA
ncbi:MAG: iron-containing redox enzyme family protein [Colwellia sp.]|nr:iron-containing redox enzyme family protein [Colwellia sp.]